MEQELLSRHDFERMLDTIYQTNSTSDVDSFAKVALSRLYILIPFDKAMLLPLMSMSGKRLAHPTRAYTYGMDAKYDIYQGEYDDDPFFLAMTGKSHPEGFCESVAYPEERKVSERIYREFYEPQGIHYAMRISLVHNGLVLAQLMLFRSKGAEDFQVRDGIICSMLSKHLAQKYIHLIEDEAPAEPEQHAESKIRGSYNLSQREYQIAEMIVAGKSDQEIAEELVISLSTVKKHVYNAYAKLGVNKRVQLIMALTEI